MEVALMELRRSQRLKKTAISANEENTEKKPKSSSFKLKVAPKEPRSSERSKKNAISANEENTKKNPKKNSKKNPKKNPVAREKKLTKKTREPDAPILLDSMEWNDVTYYVGEDVYVNLIDSMSCDESDEVVEDCRVCASHDRDETMIECDECLDGFHLGCLDPPLSEVPEGDWKCDSCSNGQPEKFHKTSRKKTTRERFFLQEVGIARIQNLWKDKNGGASFEGQWYCLPEETHQGRGSHHGRRELFLSAVSQTLAMDTVIRHCFVLPPGKYEQAFNEGDDVFKCAYQYDASICQFKMLEWDTDSEDLSYSEGSEVNETDSDDDFTDMVKPERNRGKRKRKGKGRKRSWEDAMDVKKTRVASSLNQRLTSPFLKAQAALQLSAVPPTLPCRDKERSAIMSAICKSISSNGKGLGRCIYVSGVPGTGKTATVMEVMKSVVQSTKNGDLPPFQFVHINGLRLPSPRDVFPTLYESLTGQRVGCQVALERLNDMFSEERPRRKNSSSAPTVILVDEMDQLVTRNQKVLYNLFDWCMRPNSGVIIIGIANTMDLPERLLPKIVSRLGITRFEFGAYTREQLAEIVAARLSEVAVFHLQAIKLIAMKVAATSGDVRRALEICRRALEVAEGRCASGGDSVLVELKDVDSAIKELFDSPHMQILPCCSLHEKIFMAALVRESKRTGLADCTLDSVYVTHATICNIRNITPPNFDTLCSISLGLSSCRLVIAESGSRHRLQRVQLNVSNEDVKYCLSIGGEMDWLGSML